MWNAETSNLVSGSFKEHMGGILSVCYSPDGTQIMSGSSDHTVRVWDAETGAVSTG